MKSYFGEYQNAQVTGAVESTVLIFDKNLSIGFRHADGSNAMISWLLKDVEVTFAFSTQETKLTSSKHPGATLTIKGKEAGDFIKEMQTERQKPWHQKSSGKEWIRNGLLLITLLGGLFLLYLLIVPWLSEKLASKISIKTEMQLGDAAYNAMGLAGQEDTASSYILNEFFQEMDVPTAYDIKITVVNDNMVNAFALPGGRIVVYSALLKEINSYPELAALLSHEFTHVNNKHSTKSIFRKLGSKVFLGLLFGRFGTVTSVVVDHADNLKSLKYSRKLEKEADIDGLALLAKRGIDPKGFEDLFTNLKRAAGGDAMPEFLGSHPDIDKRIAYVKEAGKTIVIKEDERLKGIFEKLK